MDPLNPQNPNPGAVPTPPATPPTPPVPPAVDPAAQAGFVRPINVQPVNTPQGYTAPAAAMSAQPVMATQMPHEPAPVSMQVPGILPPKARSSIMMKVAIGVVILLAILGGLYAYGSYVQSQQQAAQPHEGFQVTERQIDTPNFDGYESQNNYNEDILDDGSGDASLNFDASAGVNAGTEPMME